MRLEFHSHGKTIDCFFCPEPFKEGEDIVVWHGAWASQERVKLHRKCAAQLGVRLINDATRGDAALRDKVDIWLDTGHEKEGDDDATDNS